MQFGHASGRETVSSQRATTLPSWTNSTSVTGAFGHDPAVRVECVVVNRARPREVEARSGDQVIAGALGDPEYPQGHVAIPSILVRRRTFHSSTPPAPQPL